MSKAWLKHWPQGVPQSLVYPMAPVPEILSVAANNHPHSKAMFFFERGTTYRELDDLSNQFSSMLVKLGVTKGDRVALLLPNCPQFLISYFGAMRVGAVVVPCSPFYKERELVFQLGDSEAETIVALDSLYPLVASVQERTRLRNVIVTSLADSFGDTSESLTQPEAMKSTKRICTILFADLLKERAECFPKTEIDPRRDPALFQYTGGTTGVPKAAILTHYNLVVNALQFGAWLSTLREGCETVLAALPFFHIFGMTAAMNMPILRAETMVLLPKFEPADVMKAIQKHAVTFFPGVPTMYVALMNDPHVVDFNLRSVRLCISGGAPLPVEVTSKFESLISGRLVEGYGLTEASPVTHCNPVDRPENMRLGSIGIPLPDTEARIVDIETGEHDLSANESGELVISGPQVMAGYWNQPEETRHALRRGWLYTGDVARMGEDGYFYIMDRKKEVINVSGMKVWPREVEEVLYRHSAVKEAAVIGIADAYRGEVVKAYVVLTEQSKERIGPEEIIQFCKNRIASYKAPVQVEFVNDLPKTSVGKVLRRALA